MCSVSVVTVVFIHTVEDDQRLNTLVHEGDALRFSVDHCKKPENCCTVMCVCMCACGRLQVLLCVLVFSEDKTLGHPIMRRGRSRRRGIKQEVRSMLYSTLKHPYRNKPTSPWGKEKMAMLPATASRWRLHASTVYYALPFIFSALWYSKESTSI